MLELGLDSQAVTPAEERPTAFQHCSGCGQLTPPDPDEPLEPRVVQTRGGEAEWQEPKHYCRKCRQAFFPSVQEARSSSLAVQCCRADQERVARQQKPSCPSTPSQTA